MNFNEALARLVATEQNLSFIPEIVTTDWDQGGDFQYSEYTGGHDNACFEVYWKEPGTKQQKSDKRCWRFAIDDELAFAILMEKLINA